MVERENDLVCLPGDMALSVRVREQLTGIFVAGDEVEQESVASTVRWGGRWFCPGDGTQMSEVDGTIRCPACGKALPPRVLHQLIELHPHAIE